MEVYFCVTQLVFFPCLHSKQQSNYNGSDSSEDKQVLPSCLVMYGM